MRNIHKPIFPFSSREATLWLILGAIFFASVFIVSAISVDPTKVPHTGTVLQIEGFKESKVIGYSNGRYLVVLIDKAGHSKIEKWSLDTVQQFMPE